MFDVLLNLLFGSTAVSGLTDTQISYITAGAIILVILAFSFISIAFYKLMLYICKF